MNIAILIDAENVQPVHAGRIFEHAASLGDIAYKEIYGTGPAISTWVEPVLRYAIHPNLTIKASKGKNSSDIALVIGAMDLIHNVDAVILVSSDSDFSALAVRLRSEGIDVIGMGTEKSNELWRTACSSFVVLAAPAVKPKQASNARQTGNGRQSSNGRQANAKQAVNARQANDSQTAPAKKAEDAKPVASTHTERAAAIRAFIRAEIERAGGRLQTSVLFSSLNNLPEYRVDQQRSRRKPLNYLIRQYGDAFAIEADGEGNHFISMSAAGPEAVAEAEAPEVSEPEAVDSGAGEAVAEAGELQMLIAAGIPEVDAPQVVEIFTQSRNKREAYNRLRKAFGVAGRDYYNRVKAIGEGEA